MKEIISERERMVVIEEWKALFQNYRVDHLIHSFSGHCPLLINTGVRGVIKNFLIFSLKPYGF